MDYNKMSKYQFIAEIKSLQKQMKDNSEGHQEKQAKNMVIINTKVRQNVLLRKRLRKCQNCLSNALGAIKKSG